MPSGAKKRKAAKKKMEKEANNNSQGNNDLKTLDERESDGGEVSSPASQDHNNHHPFMEGEEEENRDTSSVRSFGAENKSMEEVPNNGENTQKIVADDEVVVEVVRELKSDEDSESKTVSMEYVEFAKESRDGSSSSSSSDNDLRVVEQNSELAESAELKEEAYYPVSETAPFEVLVKPVVEIDRELKSDDDYESKTVSIEYVESLKESHDGSSSGSSSDNESRVVERNSEVVDLGLETASFDVSVKPADSLSEEVTLINEDALVGKNCNLVVETIPVVDSVKPVVSLSEEVIRVTQDAPVGEYWTSVVETIPVVDLVKPVDSLSKEVIHVTKSVPVENSMNSHAAELILKENVEKLLPSLDENTGVSLAVIDLVSKKNEDKVFPVSVENSVNSDVAELDSKENVEKLLPSSIENGGTSSSTMGFASKENEDKLLQSSNAPSVETRNGVEHIKDPEIPESSENRHRLVASAPRTVETTSWTSCCGLFELLTGSNR